MTAPRSAARAGAAGGGHLAPLPASERDLIQAAYDELLGDLTNAGHLAQRVSHEHRGYCAHNRESDLCVARRALLERMYAYLTVAPGMLGRGEEGSIVTPAQDTRARANAQRAYDFAVAELARTDSPRINYGAGDYEEQRRRRDAWEDTPGLREYRSWLYEVQHVADYRRQHPITRLLRRSRNIGRVERGEYGEPTARFHWHWQNLDEDLRALDQSPTFLGLPLPDIRHQGRAWFDWYVRWSDVRPFKAEVEWSFGKAVWSSGFSYTRKNSGTITLHAALRPVASVYLTLKHLWPRKHEQPSRTYSLSIMDGALHWDFGKPGSGDEWHRNDPLNWMRGVRFLADDIFGRPEHHKEIVGPVVDAVASFPEGDYPLKLQREIRTWKRPRWPFTQVHRYVDIEAVRPAEAQGKGENSWDLGPDGIYGMSSPGHSYEDAVAAYVKATLRDRKRHGHLKPEHRSVLNEVPA